MKKEPKQYTPSPWGIEKFLEPYKVEAEKRRHYAVMPEAMKQALFTLQQDLEETEYGGAIDFELVEGYPEVERVITYCGIYGAIPWRTLERIVADPDIELTYHTHPKQNKAIPSKEDIRMFLDWQPRVMLIVAGKEMLILTKGDSTPAPSIAYTKLTQLKKFQPYTYAYLTTPDGGRRLFNMLKSVYDISMDIIPIDKPLSFYTDVVRRVSR